MLVRTPKRCRTDNLEWLLNEIGVKDISEVEGLSVSEFVEKYSRKHFSNLCLDKLIEIGAVYLPDGEILVKDLEISTRLKNILFRYNIYVLSNIVRYSKEDIMGFRHLGVETMKELETICNQKGIHIVSVTEIGEHMLGVEFTTKQLIKLFNIGIYWPEDFGRISEEQYEQLVRNDRSLDKKIKTLKMLQK